MNKKEKEIITEGGREMKLKEFYKKYSPEYYIMVFGKPLEKETIPFTHLPSDRKELMEYYVAEMKIETKEYTEVGVSFATMKPTKPIKRSGTIYVYAKKEI